MVFFPPTWHPLASVSLLSPSPEDMFFSLILQCFHMKTTPHLLKIYPISQGSGGWLLEIEPRLPWMLASLLPLSRTCSHYTAFGERGFYEESEKIKHDLWAAVRLHSSLAGLDAWFSLFPFHFLQSQGQITDTVVVPRKLSSTRIIVASLVVKGVLRHWASQRCPRIAIEMDRLWHGRYLWSSLKVQGWRMDRNHLAKAPETCCFFQM